MGLFTNITSETSPLGLPLVVLRAGSARLRSTSSDPSLVCAMSEPLTG